MGGIFAAGAAAGEGIMDAAGDGIVDAAGDGIADAPAAGIAEAPGDGIAVAAGDAAEVACATTFLPMFPRDACPDGAATAVSPKPAIMSETRAPVLSRFNVAS
jgi:hypothetical protein